MDILDIGCGNGLLWVKEKRDFAGKYKYIFGG